MEPNDDRPNEDLTRSITPHVPYEPFAQGTGPAVPISDRTALSLIIGSVGTTIVAGAVFLLVSPSLTSRCSGATRSTRLRWEQQRQEREQEIARVIASQPPAAVGSELEKGNE